MAKFIPALQHAVQHSPYDLIRYTEYQNKLDIELLDVRQQALQLQFNNPLLIRKMRESDAVDTLGQIQSSGGLARWIYKVEGSELVDWMSQQGFDKRRTEDLLHYCILTQSAVLEVVTVEAPRVLG